MTSILLTLLFTVESAAQLTTSFWAFKSYLGTDKIGYYGSVINANSSHTTLALSFDNGTDKSALGYPDTPSTFTIGPTLWEAQDDFRIRSPATASGANLFKLRCEQENPSDATANATCTAAYGPGFARRIQCNTGQQRLSSTSYYVFTHTYSGRGSYSPGVEEITRTFIFGPNTRSIPTWCSDRSFIPQENSVTTYPAPKTAFGTYQVVITAGVEKLNATQGASASFSSARPTGGSGGVSSPTVSAPPQATGNVAPLITVGPMALCLGAAVAAILA